MMSDPVTPIRSARRQYRILTATWAVLVGWSIVCAVIAATHPLSRLWAVAMPLFLAAVAAAAAVLSKIAYRWQCRYHELRERLDAQ